MVGIRRIKLLLGIFMPIFVSFLMSYNNFANAISIVTNVYNLNYSVGLNTAVQRVNNIQPGWNNRLGIGRFYWYEFKTSNINPSGDYGAIHFETNVVFNSSTELARDNVYSIISDNSYRNYRLVGCWWGATGLQILSSTVSNSFTKWTSNGYNTTMTIYADVAVGAIPNTNSPLTCQVASTLGAGVPFGNQSVAIYFEQNPASITFTGSQNSALLQTQIDQNNQIIDQNNQIINQNQTIINQNQTMINKENQASDDISDQSANDVSDAENQQTDNLIGVISGFISAFNSVSATNCNLTLDFPDFAGGSRQVNICSGKEKAPRIVEIGSSLLLIAVFVPLAYVLIRMIYNEIRSWTNG